MNIVAQSDDGLWGIITGADFNRISQTLIIGRSKTRHTSTDALAAPYDPGLVNPVGPGSVADFVKIRLSDIGVPARPLSLNPADYRDKNAPKFIPNYPHKCHVCGGKMLILFSSTEHEGGTCPGPPKREVSLRKRR